MQGHAVGGTVAGLVGDQLVLQNNATDALTITDEGTFSFASAVAEGADYDVTVLTQPKNPSQACLVANGSGTMGTQDVTDIDVTCTTNSFTVGGFVGGLLGSGLVLQNNGGDDVPMASDGSFTFATPVLSGQPFNVTVLSQPVSPEQICTVDPGTGTVGDADVDVLVDCALIDTDNDGVPDISDPFPGDGTKPVTGLANTVYAHTSTTLFTMDVTSYAITTVGAFHGSGYSGQMTDIAIDRYGVLYGVTFNNLYVCDATTAECFELASLPQSFNGLTLVPRGTIDPVQDALVGIANTGDWYRVTLTGAQQAQLTGIGAYGSGYTSAGDAFSISGVGTFASVNVPGQVWNAIVRVEPTNGTALSELGTLTGYSEVWGLAGWQGAIFAFDAGGDVLLIDPNTAAVQVIQQTSNAWWGAGVTTRM